MLDDENLNLRGEYSGCLHQTRAIVSAIIWPVKGTICLFSTTISNRDSIFVNVIYSLGESHCVKCGSAEDKKSSTNVVNQLKIVLALQTLCYLTWHVAVNTMYLFHGDI